MKDQTFLNNLTDFKDLRLASRNQLMDIENKSRDSFQSKASHCAQFDLQLQNNDKIIKNFKQLREQLKQATKNCQKLKTKLDQKQSQLDRIKQSERDYITINHQLKNQTQHLKHSNEDLRAKLQMLKSMAKNANQNQQQLEFLKININNLRTQVACLQDEKNKLLEMSIIDKVQLQEKIKKFQAKKGSDIQYVQEMEIQVSKLKQKCIKLQNQLKKLQIKYDEQIYTNKWANGNFQRQHLQQQLKQFQAQNHQLLAKHKKEKEKRNMLQKRVLQLEESSGLWIVKAETYEVQNKALQKKFKQAKKKMQQNKEQTNRKVLQVLSLQQKFIKSTAIAQQLISRVKRQLYGDMVALAKSCEFKLNKLKQQKQSFIKENTNDQMKKSTSDIKLRSKSKQKIKISEQKQADFQTQLKPTIANLRQKFQQCTKSIPEIGQQLSQKSRGNNLDSNRTLNPLSQIQNIQAKIKKQRDQMQKKIRQKMLYRKLEIAHSPQKHQLRQDYFKLLDH